MNTRIATSALLALLLLAGAAVPTFAQPASAITANAPVTSDDPGGPDPFPPPTTGEIALHF